MIKSYTILLDVGGTFIRSALLDEGANIIPNSFSIFSSKLFVPIEDILNNYVKIIKFNINSILELEFKIKHIIFSYSSSLMTTHQNKLKDFNHLKSKLLLTPSIASKLSEECKCYFIEDAYLFAIGEQILRPLMNRKNRVLYLIMGSGLSVALTENSNIVNKKNNNLLDLTFAKKDRSYISSQGILNIASSYGISNQPQNSKEIAELAKSGDKVAVKVFEEFGERLAYLLEDIVLMFAPNEIVLGGNIALSYPLFKNTFNQTINNKKIKIRATEFTSHYIFFGMSEVIKKEPPLNKI